LNEDKTRFENFMEDSKKSFVRLKNTEKKLVTVKTAAWAGVGLGAIGTGIGAFALWLMRDRGWF
tara:strand:+ start:1434 stop:1625 length:192 start_codon:yes stop_codon:yes gene_type:complete